MTTPDTSEAFGRDLLESLLQDLLAAGILFRMLQERAGAIQADEDLISAMAGQLDRDVAAVRALMAVPSGR